MLQKPVSSEKTNNEKNVCRDEPELRFPEFSEPWKITKIHKITDSITKGTTPKKYSEEGINFIKVENIENNHIININSWIDENTHHNELNRSILEENDLLFSIAGTLGRTAKVTEDILPANTNQALAIVKINDLNNINVDYVQTRLNCSDIKKYISQNLAVGAQPNLNLKQVGNIEIKIPSKLEQDKIQNFINFIDKKIGLLEKKLFLYRNFSEAIKEQLFTNLELNRKLKLNKFLKESKIKSEDDINRRLTVKLNLKGITKRDVKSVEKEGATTQYLRKEGQFIYGKQNLHKGAFGIIPKELNNHLSSSDIPSFDFIEDTINPMWFYYYFSRKNFYTKLERFSTGTGSKRISADEFLNIQINIPDKCVQNKQAEFLNNLEIKENILRNEIFAMKNYKKGLLQKMFI